MTTIALASLPEPAPLPTQLGGLITPGGITLITGDLNACPSLALALATALTLGADFGGLLPTASQTLYASPHSQTYVTARAYRVARGLGQSKPPEGLGFYPLLFTRDDALLPRNLAQASRPLIGTLVIEGVPDTTLAAVLAVLQRQHTTTVAFINDADAAKRTCAIASVVEVEAREASGHIEWRQTWNAAGPLVPTLVLTVEQTKNATRFSQVAEVRDWPLRLANFR